MKTRKLTTKDIALIGLMAAVMCLAAPFSVPIGPVPISLATLVIYFTIYLLGAASGTISCLIYLLLGLVGLPVFSGFTSGLEKLLGPTGGYLIGYLLMALVGGIFVDRYRKNILLQFLGLVLGTAACYILGTAWLAWQASLSLKAALWAGVIPFIPGDLVKIAAAMVVAPQIRRQIDRFRLQDQRASR